MLTPEELAALPTDRENRTRVVLNRAMQNAVIRPDPVYVFPDGKHCIAGEALSLMGVSDDDLRGATPHDNVRNLFGRADLRDRAIALGLDERLLERAQDAADALAGAAKVLS